MTAPTGVRPGRINAKKFGQLVELMLTGDHNSKELADLTGLHYVTVLDYTRHLWLAGAAHITRWEPDQLGRHMTKVYQIGKAKDAKRPAKTQQQHNQEYTRKRQALHNPLLQLGRASA